MNNQKVWFLSDPHYGHKNICEALSTWTDKSGVRKFKSVEEMNDAIVKSINDVVGPNDLIICLGDWSFGGIHNIYAFWSRLVCKNIIIVPGNHDHHIKNDSLLDSTNGNVYPTDIFGILPELFKYKAGKHNLILCHYPLEQWEDMDRGSIHLHGHVHHTLDNSETNKKYRRLDVGWTPEKGVYLLDDIISEMSNKEMKQHYGNRNIL